MTKHFPVQVHVIPSQAVRRRYQQTPKLAYTDYYVSMQAALEALDPFQPSNPIN